MKLMIGLLAFAGLLGAQALDTPRYITYKQTDSATSEKITIQQVTGGKSNTVHFDKAVIQCSDSAGCVVTLSQNGTAATTTALSIIPVNLSPGSRSVAFSGSNVGTGTVLGTYTLSAAGMLVLDISQLYLSRNAGGSNNLTIGITGASQTFKVQVNHTEQ